MGEPLDDLLWEAHNGQPCETCGLRLVDVYEERVVVRLVVLDEPLVAAFMADDEPPVRALRCHYEAIPPRVERRWVGVSRG